MTELPSMWRNDHEEEVRSLARNKYQDGETTERRIKEGGWEGGGTVEVRDLKSWTSLRQRAEINNRRWIFFPNLLSKIFVVKPFIFTVPLLQATYIRKTSSTDSYSVSFFYCWKQQKISIRRIFLMYTWKLSESLRTEKIWIKPSRFFDASTLACILGGLSTLITLPSLCRSSDLLELHLSTKAVFRWHSGGPC